MENMKIMVYDSEGEQNSEKAYQEVEGKNAQEISINNNSEVKIMN